MAEVDNEQVNNIEVGIIGGGSMGKGMTLLFSEHGSRDYDTKAVHNLMQEAKEDQTVDEKLVFGFTSIQKLANAFPKQSGQPRLIVLSLPHGKPVDGILEDLLPIMEKGDIVIDAGNEWWADTERRQKVAAEKGWEWVGMGVSGGYQAARHGPSMSVGCTEKTWEFIKPYLEKWCAHTPSGEPCVARMGPGGAGHYVKMIHNGIEHAHLSILCEVRGLLYHQYQVSNDVISDVFEKWYKDGPLRGNFLVGIGYKGLRFKEGDGIKDERGIVEGIEDKVTQDVDLSEGTGTWSTRVGDAFCNHDDSDAIIQEIAQRHVAAPAIAASHCLRIISANRDERLKVVENLKIPQASEKKVNLDKAELDKFLDIVEQAVYGGILGAFVQGLEMITKASSDEKWDVSLETCIKIWRAGCIIQSDAIAELLLPLLKSFPPSQPLNLLSTIPEVSKILSSTYQPMKQVYAIGIEKDAVMPAVGATVEWLKAIGGKQLPTDFEEMELDYFGHHNYDLKSEPVAGHEKGKYHTEFQST
ncbi:hypothetical protein P7C73_g543, partial [Tremellales sp. Uapishka_1]